MTTLKDRPLIMTGESVRAAIERRKTETRRVLAPQITTNEYGVMDWHKSKNVHITGMGSAFFDGVVRFGDFQIGQRLWVKETWATLRDEDECTISRLVEMNAMGPASLFYKADGTPDHSAGKWRSPLYMPRAYSRLTLEVVSVKVERLTEITIDDAIAEGVFANFDPSDGHGFRSEAVNLFRERWQAINGKREGCSWEDNPWVSAIGYKVVTQPVGREER